MGCIWLMQYQRDGSVTEPIRAIMEILVLWFIEREVDILR